MLPRHLALGVLIALTLVAVAPASAAANRPPSCVGTTAAIAPGGDRVFSLACEDFDGPRSPELEIVDAPDHGSIEELGGARIRFVPAAGYAGPDEFTFRASDGLGQSAVVTQEIRVTNANLAPVCPAREVLVVGGYESVGDVCVDPNEGDAARVVVDEEPEHGTVHSNASSNLEYSARSGFLGPDVVTVHGTDGTLEGDPVEITFVSAALTAPTCQPPPTIPVRTNTTKSLSARCTDNAKSPLGIGLQVVDHPDHGDFQPSYAGTAQYVPDTDYSGPDQFVVRAVNSAGQSAPFTVYVSISPQANEPPTCSTFPLRLRSGLSASVPSGCSDPDGDPLDLSFTTPAHGGLAEGMSGPFPILTYTADDGYGGPDQFTLRADDGRALSAPVVQPITVVGDDDNIRPECRAVATRTLENQALGISLQCLDADRDALTITTTQPDHGSVGGAQNQFGSRYVTYTPATGYVGDDRFTFTADDGHGGTTTASVLILVAEPVAPRCTTPTPRSVRTSGQLRIAIFCGDETGGVDTTLHADAAHGTVTDEGYGSFLYEPDEDYEGPDEFTVRASNAVGNTDVVQQITVSAAANTVPSCSPASQNATRQAPVELHVSCYDEDGDALTLQTVAGPAHGDLGAWNGRTVTYTPDDAFVGEDEFTFKALDGRGESLVVTQTVRVRSLDDNERPSCQSAGTQTEVDSGPIHVSVWCYDADQDQLTYAIVDQPDHGTAGAPQWGGGFSYTPDPGFEGIDEIGVTANDGRETSLVATIRIQVGNRRAPTCTPLAANVAHDTPRSLNLTCSSFFLMPVLPEIVEEPAHGTLSAVGPDGRVTYTPDLGYAGADRFTYRGSEGGLQGTPAAVELVVRAREGEEQVREDPPPPPSDTSSPPDVSPPPPPSDPAQEAARRSLGGTAVPAPGLTLRGTRAFVPASLADGVVEVDAARLRLLALVCTGQCEVTVGQQVVLGSAGARAAAAKRLTLRRQKLRLRAAQAGVVHLRLTKSQRRRLKRARRGTLQMTVAVKDASGRTVRDSVRFRLRPR